MKDLRHWRQITGYFLLGVAVVVIGSFVVFPHTSEVTKEDDVQVGKESLDASNPTSLMIPSLAIDTTFVAPLSLAPDGTVQVPDSYTQVGWYMHGPTPGERGPAVILGHIDSFQGPAVFYSLRKLKVGEDIFVTREDGRRLRFVVESLERYPQSDFPTAMVYGDIDYPGLRLITCSGVYKKGDNRYTHNLVVYARLIEEGS